MALRARSQPDVAKPVNLAFYFTVIVMGTRQFSTPNPFDDPRIPVPEEDEKMDTLLPTADAPRDRVLYDDACAMCSFQMAVFTWLDWMKRLEMLPVSSGLPSDVELEADRDELLREIHVLTSAGKVHRGARAVRYVSARLPLLWPLAVLLWIPGVIWIADAIYRLVAAKRMQISRIFGCKTACRIVPPRQRPVAAPPGDHGDHGA